MRRIIKILELLIYRVASLTEAAGASIDQGRPDGVFPCLEKPRRRQNGASIDIRALEKRFGTVRAGRRCFADDTRQVNSSRFSAPAAPASRTVLMKHRGFRAPHGRPDRHRRRGLHHGFHLTSANIGMVFQHYTLFPHLSVADNVAFPLKMRGVAKSERSAPGGSGSGDGPSRRLRRPGMPKAIVRRPAAARERLPARKFVLNRPRVLLMDEPLSALDKNLREEMQLEIKAGCIPSSAPTVSLRDPRPGRGTDHGRPDRHPQGRQACSRFLLHANCTSGPSNLFSAGFHRRE